MHASAMEGMYTAISINVLGKRRQAYATRPKGSMGRTTETMARPSQNMYHICFCFLSLKRVNTPS